MTIAQTEIEIHEFSTGIRPERTADGGWVSLGFTGQYMNATINPVPHAIQRSIANKEFAVAEGASSDEPAIIGRIVSSEDSDWSVVAVVTKGRDEKGRSASLYRYFFCEGDKGVSNLWRIIGWIEDYQRSHNGEMPVFNPFDTRELEQPNLYTTSTPPQFNLLPETEASLLSDSAPILIPAEAQYTLQDINRLANKKAIADENHQPIAWAYKVKALEQPGRFQIIQAASDKAYELLQKVKATTPQVVAPLIDEQAFKAAIKGLINSSRVKLEYVQAIAEPLGNDRIPESYWKEIFDSQGANNALKQAIYSPQMVRLLTLRAIVIPQTLPEYLAWLEKGNKQNDSDKVSDEFQAQIRISLNQISHLSKNIEFNITDGIKILLPKLLNEQKPTLETVSWLLASPNGLWARFTRQFLQNIELDLQSMSQFAKGSEDFKLTDKAWQKIRGELEKYWQIRSCAPQEKYQSFSKLFEQLHQYKLAAFFYHIGLGIVPREIFLKLCPNGWHCLVYGVSVEREVTILEKLQFIIEEVRSTEVRVPFVIIFALISLSIGVGVGSYTGSPKSLISWVQAQVNRPKVDTNDSSIQSSEQADNQNCLPQSLKNEAVKNFPTTITLLQEAVKQLEKDPEIKMQPGNIKSEIKKILISKCPNFSDNNLDLMSIKAQKLADEQTKIKWINAIYFYQFNNNLKDKKGYITETNNNNFNQLDLLKSEIKTKLIKQEITK